MKRLELAVLAASIMVAPSCLAGGPIAEAEALVAAIRAEQQEGPQGGGQTGESQHPSRPPEQPRHAEDPAMTDSALHRASRVASIEVSEIVRLSEAAAVMRREGRDVIGLGTGEPDFDTPGHVVEAAARAMREGLTKYAPTGQRVDLVLQALPLPVRSPFGIDVNPE